MQVHSCKTLRGSGLYVLFIDAHMSSSTLPSSSSSKWHTCSLSPSPNRPPAPCPSGQASIFRSRLHLGNARQWDLIHATPPLFNPVFQQVSAALDVEISIILPFRSPSIPESCELPLLRRCSQQATRTAKRTRIITQLTFSFLNFSCRFSVKAWRVLCGQKQLLLSTKMSPILT